MNDPHDPVGRARLGALLTEEASQADPVGVVARGAIRLHRARRGNISILFIFMYLGFFCAAAMVWNTGYTIAARVHVQTAADAAAYGASVWNARCMNIVTGTNMLINRHLSAEAISMYHLMWTIVGVPGVPIMWANKLKDLAAVPFVGAALAAAGAVYIALVEVPPYVKTITAGVVPAATSGNWNLVGGPLASRVDDLYKFQRAWVQSTPTAIDNMRKQLENYYGCTIRLTRPGETTQNAKKGLIDPPVVQGNFLTMLFPLTVRQIDERNKWPDYAPITKIKWGKGMTFYNASYYMWHPLMAIIHGSKHHVLKTHKQYFVFERPIWQQPDLTERRDYSVIATVVDDAKSENLVGRGVYDEDVTPKDVSIAYAQSETFNGANGVFFFWPIFRLWSTQGWRWEARLAQGDQLEAALKSDKTMQNHWKKIGVKAANYSQLKNVAQH